MELKRINRRIRKRSHLTDTGVIDNEMDPIGELMDRFKEFFYGFRGSDVQFNIIEIIVFKISSRAGTTEDSVTGFNKRFGYLKAKTGGGTSDNCTFIHSILLK